MSDHPLNFSIANIEGVTVTAGIASARVELPNTDAPDIMIVNASPSVVFVRTGDETVVADTDAMPVLPGEKGVYSVGRLDPPVTHIAYITLAGLKDITIVRGFGV